MQFSGQKSLFFAVSPYNSAISGSPGLLISNNSYQKNYLTEIRRRTCLKLRCCLIMTKYRSIQLKQYDPPLFKD